MLHYAYLRVEQFEHGEEYGIVICSKMKLDVEDRLIFGRGEYGIRVEPKYADKIKMKYIESYGDLCKYLTAFAFY